VGVNCPGFFPDEVDFTDAGFASDFFRAVAVAGSWGGEADLAFGLGAGDFSVAGALGAGVALVGGVAAEASVGSAVTAADRAVLGDFTALASDLAEAVTVVLGGSTWGAAAFADEPVFGADVARAGWDAAGRDAVFFIAAGAGVGFGAGTGEGVGADAAGGSGTDGFGATAVGAFRVGLDSVAREEARFRDFGVMVRELRMPAGMSPAAEDWSGGTAPATAFPGNTFRRTDAVIAAGPGRWLGSRLSMAAGPILPGATLGVLGSGQLGRMFTIAARRLGYRVHIYSPDSDTPAGQVGDVEFVAPYDDLDRVRDFARGVSVVTFEFENVPSATSRACAEIVPVRPDGEVLHITQHRLREKTFLRENGFPVTPFRRIQSLADLEAAARDLGLPAVLKTASFGYDGKGQQNLRAAAELPEAFARLNGAEGICEAFVDFSNEVSLVAARTLDGNFAAFPVFENLHTNHILDVSVTPASIALELEHQAAELARGILEALKVVGLLTVEMFVTRDGRLLVNEMAPRTHNSGHLTIDGCVTSQFEQQLRAVCGLPLGSTELRRPTAMCNLLGDVWFNAGGQPDWPAVLADPLVKLHLYGKAEPRRGRKMGHLTAAGATVDEAIARVRLARSRLERRAPLSPL
jgi:5-(carboxyamino)imidazole ribonucleotide synthase